MSAVQTPSAISSPMWTSSLEGNQRARSLVAGIALTCVLLLVGAIVVVDRSDEELEARSRSSVSTWASLASAVDGKASLVAGVGYPAIVNGSSYIQAVTFGANGPDARAIVTVRSWPRR